MDEQKVIETIKKFAEGLPRFSDGRIDYSSSDVAPVITVVIKYKDKILLLRRSERVGTYKGKWNFVAGYLDELRPIREKILEELNEELGLDESFVSSICFGEPYKFKDKEINKTWIIHPVLVELKRAPEIKLDWEHVEYKWLEPEDVKNFDIVPRLEESLRRVLRKK